MDFAEVKARLVRRAIQFQIGGFRPEANSDASWFGQVKLAARGETWPLSAGKPMHALCQINIEQLPFRPAGLDDIALIGVFIGPDDLPNCSPNGSNWCLRAYPTIETLVPLSQGDSSSPIKALPMRSRVIEEDYPMWEDVSIELPDEIADDYYDHFENVSGLKIGGWPTLIQSEIFWAPWNKHPAAPRYVFQIDSTEKGNWSWGDRGVGYFGRGTTEGHTSEWACDWQCY
jgi:uncharacterized protein YwqG